MKHLILFDVDGTLLSCGPQVRPLFVGALEQVFGGYGRIEGYQFSGKTDPRITLDLVRAAGRLSDEEILARLPAMRRTYFERLERGLRREKMCILPGVEALLERLAARSDVLLALLTGNWQRGAMIKLSRFGLERYFAFGAFGDDGVDRRELLPKALERARRHGRRFEPEEVLIVGDSELDVDCARSGGVPSLAVATGFTPAERLRAAGADWVFDDLTLAARDFEIFAA